MVFLECEVSNKSFQKFIVTDYSVMNCDPSSDPSSKMTQF